MIQWLGSMTDDYLHCLIGVSLIALCILLIRKIGKKTLSKRFMYGLWIFIPLYMLIFPLIQIPMPAFIGNMCTIEWTTTDMEPEKSLHSGGQEILWTGTKQQDYTSGREENVLLRENVSGDMIVETDSGGSGPEVKTPASFSGMIMLAYLMLVFAGVIWILLKNILFGMQCGKCRHYLYDTEHLQVPVYELKGINNPFLFGKAIYLPENYEKKEESHYAILHEECHYKQGDALWVVLRHLILCIFFYNPIVWKAFQYSGYDCELSCDEAVLKNMREIEKKSYGETLLNAVVPGKSIREQALLSTNLHGGKSLLRQRIESIVQERKHSIAAVISVIVLLCLVLCGSLMHNMPVKAQQIITNPDGFDAALKVAECFKKSTISLETKSNHDISEAEEINVCLEIWSRPIWEEENSFTVEDNGRELTLVSEGGEAYFKETDFAVPDIVTKHLAEDILGKKVGAEITEIVQNRNTEYHYIFTVLDNDKKGEPAYTIPVGWSYEMQPYKLGNYYTEECKEDEAGHLYGFTERFQDYGSLWGVGIRKYYTNAEASSTLAPQGIHGYHEGNTTTCSRYCTWSEGVSGNGIGEYIELRQLYMGPGEEVLSINEFCIVNGYTENTKKWRENGRVKFLNVYFEDTFIGTIHLEDTMKPQYIDLSPLQLTVGNGREAKFRFEITEVYKGTKYEDTCITGIEIGFTGRDYVTGE